MAFYFGGTKTASFNFNGGIDPPPQEDMKIKIELTGEKEIWPFLPNQTNGYSRGADRPGYNPKTNIKVSVNQGNQPVPNKSVIITIKRIEGTGGHDHLNSLPLDKCGIIKVGGNKGNPITTTTNQNGKIITDEILASQVSGKYIIEATLESNPSIKDTVHISVRVPGLIDFRSILSNNWVLVQRRPGHNSNHWCNKEMSYLLSSAIMDFYDWNVGYSKKKNKDPIILAVNDMSLIWGGSYEYMGDWNLDKLHSFHRVGLSVDIERNGSGLSRFEETQLRNYMELNGGIKYPEAQIH